MRFLSAKTFARAAFAIFCLLASTRGAPVCAADAPVPRLQSVALAPRGDLARALVTIAPPKNAPRQIPQAADFRLLIDGRDAPITRATRAFSGDDALAIAVVVDTSGSVARDFARVKSAALNCIGSASTRDAIGVVSFDAVSRVRLHPTRDKEVARDVVSRLQPTRGNTALFDALDAARALLANAPRERRAIVLISDGRDNTSSLTNADLERLATHDDLPRVYALSLGARENRSALHRVAQLSGGAFFSAANASQNIAALFRRVRADASDSWQLLFAAPKGGRHRVQVAVRTPGGEQLVSSAVALTVPLSQAEAARLQTSREARSRRAWLRVLAGFALLMLPILAGGWWLLRRRPVAKKEKSETKIGREAACLVSVAGPLAGKRFVVPREGALIGRDAKAAIRLEDGEVSRRHAEIVRGEDGIFSIRDAGSTNGIAVNEHRVERAILHDGDHLQIGASRFVFRAA